MNYTSVDMINYATDTLMYSVFGNPLLFFFVTGAIIGLILNRLGMHSLLSATISTTYILIGAFSVGITGGGSTLALILILILNFAGIFWRG